MAKKRKGETDFQDSLNEKDNPLVHRDSEDEEKVYRTMIRLEDFDAVISIFGIECIEKRIRFVEHPHPRFQYGIAINAGMEPSMRYPKTDLYAWYEKEEYRDEVFNDLLNKLSSLGIKVIDLRDRLIKFNH